MRITIPTTHGMFPAVAPGQLDPSYATLARDCILGSGEIRPLRRNKHIWTMAKHGEIKTIYRYAKQFWLHWTVDVDVVPTMVPNDTMDTIYWSLPTEAPKASRSDLITGGGNQQYPNGWRSLGVPVPEGAPTVNHVLTPDEDEDLETRVYTYTFVNDWGWESAPAPPSMPIIVNMNDPVWVQGLATPPTGPFNIVAKRIYRTITGLSGRTEFLFVGEIPATMTEVTDEVPLWLLGEVLPTEGWFPPPDELHGLTALANGVLAGFVGKDVYFTPPYAPYAWPREHMVSVEYPIVGLAAMGMSLVILTEGHPYLATGVDPSAVTLAKLEIAQSCVSKRGIVSFGADGIVYPSPDGLVAITPEGPSLLTEGILSRDDWQRYNPSSLVAAAHDGAYIGFFTGADFPDDRMRDRGGIWFRPGFGLVELSQHATAAWTDLFDDTLYLAVAKDVRAFDRDTDGFRATYQWRSKVFHTPPVSFSCARIVAREFDQDHPVWLRIYNEAREVLFEIDVTSANAFRLPPALAGKRIWQIEASGNTPIEAVELASSMRELKGGQ